MAAEGIRERSEVPLEETCATESVFASAADWEDAFSAMQALLPRLSAFQGRLHEGPATLRAWLELWEEAERRLGRLTAYAGMRHAADTRDAEAAARHDRVRALASRVAAACAFADPELLALGAPRLAEWMECEPFLRTYAYAFQRLERRRAHTRSAEVEELLGALGDPFRAARATHGILADADLVFTAATSSQGEVLPVTQGTIAQLLVHPDRQVRRTAWESYADAHWAHRHALANCLATGVKQHVLLARTRGYRSCLEAALEPNDIPPTVFHNLLASFRRHLPVWHRYWRLRRSALGYAELAEYDIKAPLGAHPPRVPYAQAVAWIAEGMRPLGDEYVAVLERGATTERWVDRSINRGKRAGAFSDGAYDTPPFVLMSYGDDMFSLSTLAHELGHSLHSWYARRAQPYVYSGYAIFVAEVASNFQQALVRHHLLQTRPERDLQIAVLEEAMSNYHRYLFLMPILARFELEIHERVERGKALTAEGLITLLADLFAEGYGGEVVLDRERTGITWAEFPTHLYANFYVYQYATGISAAHALANQVLAGGEDAARRYLSFLRAGGSVEPLEALRLAGVDLTDPAVLDGGFAAVAATVERLEQLLGGG
jgi:oligoendopeptidase F